MNSKQNSTKTMYRRVSNFIKKYLQILGVLPNFTALQTEFEANLTQLDTLGNQQGQQTYLTFRNVTHQAVPRIFILRRMSF